MNNNDIEDSKIELYEYDGSKWGQVYHPWRRFFARTLDLSVYALIWLSLLSQCFHVNILRRSGLMDYMDSLIVALLMLAIEPILIYVFGTTLGKWIFALSLKKEDGGNPGVKEVFGRTWSMIGAGLGYGIPVYNLVCQWKSYTRCRDKRQQPWDEGFVYTIKDTKLYHTVVYLVAYGILIGIQIFLYSIVPAPPNRGELTVAEFAENYNMLSNYYGQSNGYYLNSDGDWATDPLNNTFYIEMNEMPLPKFQYTLENGMITSIHSETIVNSTEDWLYSNHSQLMLAALAYVGASEEIGFFSDERQNIIKTIAKNSFQDFGFTKAGIQVESKTEFSGYTEQSGMLIPVDQEQTYFRNEFSMERLVENNIERHPYVMDYTMMFGKLDKLPEKSDFGYDVRSTDLSESDLSNDYNKLLQTTFDSKTVWPNTLPEGFSPDKIMEQYKNPGLNIRSLHEKGITGKGVGIAIIDQPLLVDYVEYKEQLKYYAERDTVNTQPASMHGAAVASIAVGKNVGVAPEADLYYIADDFLRVKDDYSLLAESINQLLDINKSLPTEHRIRVISISWGYDTEKGKGSDKLNKAYKRAEEEGILVITTSIGMREDMEFFGLDKIPLSDPDDFNSYTKNLYGMNNLKYNISVPMNYRCLASSTGSEDYAVYREGGKSWATPYVAGIYALACQVKPYITYKEFWKLVVETARTSEGTYEGESYKATYIVDPVALLKKLGND